MLRACRIPAVSTALGRARRCAEDAAADFGFGSRERYAFVVAVNEAVTNAIRHGEPDADGMIELRIEARRDTLTCSVSDSGCFRPEPDSAGTDPMRETGRGFMLMENLTDEVELSTTPAGTVLRLHKRRSPRAVGPGE